MRTKINTRGRSFVNIMNACWSRIYSSAFEQSSVLEEPWAQEHQDAFHIDANSMFKLAMELLSVFACKLIFKRTTCDFPQDTLLGNFKLIQVRIIFHNIICMYMSNATC